MQRLALVTGCAGAIGSALVRRLKDAGWLVVGMDLILPTEVYCDYFIQVDLHDLAVDPAYAEEVLSELKSWLGPRQLDALINNAAYQYISRVHPIDIVEIEKSIRVNAIAPYMLFCGLRHVMRDGGSVLNIGSIHSRLTKPGFLAYAMSKSALASVTRSLAQDFGNSVSVNCIEPASIETQMLRAGFQDDPEKKDMLDAYHPLGRMGQPWEVAELAFMIVSSRVPFLQGACIDLSGGISSRLHDPE